MEKKKSNFAAVFSLCAVMYSAYVGPGFASGTQTVSYFNNKGWIGIFLGETLSCTSGGNYPGVMHVTKNGDTYTVSSFDQVADGSNFDSSAKELFGDNYDAFMKVYSDSDARTALRITTVSNYVKANGLAVTQYQDYGWDPVQLNK